MKKVSTFDVLNKLAEEDNQELHMYQEDNITAANSGKRFGWIKMNISNNDVWDMWLGVKKRRFMLLTFLDGDYQRVKNELEKD